ncbi:MAG: 7,8-didemethyl-8-hydroxy-5-deazariboflavin synthase subunit CofH [Candidatus Heimdallarchaeota archaeon]|nr:7,8-didemethyl-8-hydroxy-5-deazariboflavin synthase subunit CofH [Candidatus Heimdallarchaeota archaeon]
MKTSEKEGLSVQVNQKGLKKILKKAMNDDPIERNDLSTLFHARGHDIIQIAQVADVIRERQVGESITYVVNRNINFTNVCTRNCLFCAYSVSEKSQQAYFDISTDYIKQKITETHPYEITEVCVQGGIHPDLRYEHYKLLIERIHEIDSSLHIHAFSPQEISYATSSTEMDIEDVLRELIRSGLGSIPGTAAEILDDSIRKIICPNKVTTDEWTDIIEIAHDLGLRSTATILFGHIENSTHWITHLHHIKKIQEKTKGFTEFIPLPFISDNTPLNRQKEHNIRSMSSLDYILFYAVSRLYLGSVIPNLQTSWVKLGFPLSQILLTSGCNDFGGTLFEENITRSAGGDFGQKATPEDFQNQISMLHRPHSQRGTLYNRIS